MRPIARSTRITCLLAIAFVCAACAPGTPATDTAAEASTDAGAADPTPADTAAPPATALIAGPTYDAPCPPARNGAAHLSEAPPRAHAFALREDIRACVTLRTQAEGGRRSAVFSNYRPSVRFVDADGEVVAMHLCALHFDVKGAIDPGSTVAAHLKCEGPVEIEDRSAFVLVEGGREVGVGTVVLPPA